MKQPSEYASKVIGHNPERDPPKSHPTKVWLQLSKYFHMKRFSGKYPVTSYVKPESLDEAILVGMWGHQAQF